MHAVFALLSFVVVIHWVIFPYPPGLLHWHCGNLTTAPVPAKQPWWIWINTSSEFIMNDCITTTKQSTTKPCAYFLEFTVIIKNTLHRMDWDNPFRNHCRRNQRDKFKLLYCIRRESLKHFQYLVVNPTFVCHIGITNICMSCFTP